MRTKSTVADPRSSTPPPGACSGSRPNGSASNSPSAEVQTNRHSARQGLYTGAAGTVMDARCSAGDGSGASADDISGLPSTPATGKPADPGAADDDGGVAEPAGGDDDAA